MVSSCTASCSSGCANSCHPPTSTSRSSLSAVLGSAPVTRWLWTAATAGVRLYPVAQWSRTRLPARRSRSTSRAAWSST